MLTREDLESWNSYFPNCKINETNLKNPNEEFLTQALCAYLRKFGYKVDLLDMGPDMLQEKRFFLIKLVRHIDYILKISDKTYTFTYYDLISPTRKKTSKMLSILLNYLHYYNMYKMDTIIKTNERIKVWQELQNSVKKLQQEIQQNEIEEKKIADEIEQSLKKTTAIKAKLQKLETAKENSSKQLDAALQVKKSQEDEINTLNTQKRQLKSQIVPNAESKELQTQIKIHEENVKKYEQFNISLEQQMQERKEQVQNLQEMIKKLHESKTLLPQKTLYTLKEQNDLLVSKEKELAKSKFKEQDLKEQIEQHDKTIKMVEQELQQKRMLFEDNLARESKLIEECNKKLQVEKKQLFIAEQEEKSVESQWAEELAIDTYLEQQISQLTLEFPQDEN